MNKGFYTALGTPLDQNGAFCADSMTEQIRQQIEAGASGLLVMGSMGNEAYLRDCEYPHVAEAAAAAAAGQVPVLVGVTDVSIGRVIDRMHAIAEIPGIDGVVSTVPYYSTVNQENIYQFYNHLANVSRRPVYLYDLAVVTKAPTLPQTVQRLWKNPNIRGIKSGNLVTHRLLLRAQDRPDYFTQMFSNIDEFDIAYQYGIERNLDGMFSCTPRNSAQMYSALDRGDHSAASDALDRILALRDLFLTTPCLMMAYSYAMNLIGCPGNFGVDYHSDISPEDKERVRSFMKQIGEL